MKKIISYKIDKEIVVKDFLLEKGYSHDLISLLKRTFNGIMINDNYAFTNRLLKKDDILTLKIVDEKRSDIPFWQQKLEVIYEDEDILIVNKPANLNCHPTFYDNKSLGNIVMNYYADDPNFVLRIITRLDKGTSGLVLLAKNALSACLLNKMMKSKMIKRNYLGIAHNKFLANGKVTTCLLKQKDSSQRIVADKGPIAITNYKTLMTNGCYSLVEFDLETGRTHQIRAHCLYLGCPLVGDKLYGITDDFSHQALHAYKLSFTHPLTLKKLCFEIELPKDLSDLKDKLFKEVL